MELFRFTNWNKNIFRAKLFSHSDSVRGCSEGRGRGGLWGEQGNKICAFKKPLWNDRQWKCKYMQHVDNAHLNLSADRPPFHTPGRMIASINTSRGKRLKRVMIVRKRDKQKSQQKCIIKSFWLWLWFVPGTKLWINVSWNTCRTVHVHVPEDACPDTHHVERHDDHKVDADASARGGKLPVLLHKIPVEGGELLHGDETENHHSKHGRQNEGDLSQGDDKEKNAQRRRLCSCFVTVISTIKNSCLDCRGFILWGTSVRHKKENLCSDKQNAQHSNVISQQEKLGYFHCFITVFIQQGEMLCHSWLIPKWHRKWWWSHSESESQKGRLFKDQRVYHEEYSGHGHHEPAEFVWERLERLRLSRDGIDSFHPGVLGFKLRPQFLLIQNTHPRMNYWTAGESYWSNNTLFL